MIEWAACLSSEQQESLWRQSSYLQDQHKKRFHKARNLKRSTSSNESLREARQYGIETVHAEYVAYPLGKMLYTCRQPEAYPQG